MASKKLQAFERLAVKLSALRSTLRGAERELLDQMVLAAKTEVEAHGKAAGKSLAKYQRTTEIEAHGQKLQGKSLGKTLAKSEVAAHSAKVSGKSLAKYQPASEVEAHAAKLQGKSLAKYQATSEVEAHRFQINAPDEGKSMTKVARAQINKGKYAVVVE